MEQMRPGLIQLEIGVQSTNMETVHEIDRVMDLDLVRNVTAKVKSFGNIHQLSLIHISGISPEAPLPAGKIQVPSSPDQGFGIEASSPAKTDSTRSGTDSLCWTRNR